MTYEKNAKYAFTLKGEFDKNANLSPDEIIYYESKLRLNKNFISQPQAYFALTNKRIILIKHYAFRPDIIISIDLKDINKLGLINIGKLNLVFPLMRWSFINLQYCGDKVIDLYEDNGGYKYWRASNSKTEKLYERILSLFNPQSPNADNQNQ